MMGSFNLVQSHSTEIGIQYTQTIHMKESNTFIKYILSLIDLSYQKLEVCRCRSRQPPKTSQKHNMVTYKGRQQESKETEKPADNGATSDGSNGVECMHC